MNFLPQLAVWPISGRNFEVEVTKELILASWRSKKAKAYDSHFKKWLGWCTEGGLHPISGPISTVANFLADLYAQDY